MADDPTAAVNAALSKVFALANDHAFTPEGWSTPVVSINRLAEIVAAVSGGAS